MAIFRRSNLFIVDKFLCLISVGQATHENLLPRKISTPMAYPKHYTLNIFPVYAAVAVIENPLVTMVT